MKDSNKIYVAQFTGNGKINKKCWVDKIIAEHNIMIANENLPWYQEWLGYRWTIKEIEVIK